MVIKSQSFLSIFAFLVSSAPFGVSTAYGGRKTLAADVKARGPISAPTSAPDCDEGFVALNPKDLKVVELAKFVIDEYNREQNTSLCFTKVIEAAYTNIARGLSYGLVIAVTDQTALYSYDANVLVNQDSKTLVAIKKNE
ncbi:hypothetical protein BUALT_Bualt03G0086400 [Buddleja alternifolia]|uniref:Cystatin domain-containing protein n=1 Tax=Buddleja alternifolia TaxID=168488 RepID=A0AAV6XZI1_9LAMI|nr:hypothetical protein BUALT_Bualt03G0086400 [Buddleja alternifolia]